jgi:hypothetical protein
MTVAQNTGIMKASNTMNAIFLKRLLFSFGGESVFLVLRCFTILIKLEIIVKHSVIGIKNTATNETATELLEFAKRTKKYVAKNNTPQTG